MNDWKIATLKPVIFLCCLEASENCKASKDINYNFRYNNISQNTSLTFSSYLFQLLLLYPEKLDEIYNLQMELHLPTETYIILSYLWINSIPPQNIINFPWLIYTKWLNKLIESKNINVDINEYIFKSLSGYIITSNNLISTLLYINYINSQYKSPDNNWDKILYEIYITLSLSVITNNVYSIYEISQSSIFDVIMQLFNIFSDDYTILYDILNKINKTDKQPEIYDIINLIDVTSNETKIISLFNILPDYFNTDFLWFYIIYYYLKHSNFADNLNDYEKIFKYINYIKSSLYKRSLLLYLWNEYLYPSVRVMVEKRENQNQTKSDYLTNLNDIDLLKYKMTVIQFSIDTLTDIKISLDIESEDMIILDEIFPKNNLLKYNFNDLQELLNNSIYDLFSQLSIDIHILYLRIVRLLTPYGDLFSNQWIELLDIFECKNYILIPNSILKSVFKESQFSKDNYLNNDNSILFLIKTLESHTEIAYELGNLLNIPEEKIKTELCRILYIHNEDSEGEVVFNSLEDKTQLISALFYLSRQRLSYYIYNLSESKIKKLEEKADKSVLKWLKNALPRDTSKIPYPLPYSIDNIISYY